MSQGINPLLQAAEYIDQWGPLLSLCDVVLNDFAQTVCVAPLCLVNNISNWITFFRKNTTEISLSSKNVQNTQSGLVVGENLNKASSAWVELDLG